MGQGNAAGFLGDAVGDQRLAPYLRLYLRGNPLSEAARTHQIETLRKLGVRVHLD